MHQTKTAPSNNIQLIQNSVDTDNNNMTSSSNIDEYQAPSIISESLINDKPLPQQQHNIQQEQNGYDEDEDEYEESDEFFDVIGITNGADTEPTIIDAWNAFMTKCCCCCKCKCCNIKKQNESFREIKKEDNWEDEVEKAMNNKHKRDKSIKNKNNVSFHHKIFSVDSFNPNNANFRDLRTALIENDNDNLYEKSKSKSKSNSYTLTKSKKNKHSSARMRCYCIPCLKYKPLIWQLISISIVIQCLGILIMGTIDMIDDEHKQRQFKLFSQIIIGIMWFIQLMVLIQLILICVKKLWDLKLREIVQLYLTSILIFTGVYITAYFYDNNDKKELKTFEAFNLDETEFADSNYMERVIAFFYLSCSQQTLCGVCEIIPKSPPTMILAGLQMLFGIFFSIIIISIGISRLGEDIEKRHHDKDIERKQRKDKNKNISMRTNYDNLLHEGSCWHNITHHERIIKIRRGTRRFLLLIVITVQAIKNTLEWTTMDSQFAKHHNNLHSLLFIIFDIINVLLVLMTSLKFVHVGHMTELRLSFLCQTYLSTMLIFTGVYVDLQVSWSTDYANGAFYTAEGTYHGMWVKFVYFSFAMMTLCGAGLDIKPRRWYAVLAVCNEMLLGLFFHVYIFGIGLLLLANTKYCNDNKKKRRKRSIISSQISSNIDKESIVSNQMVGSELIMSTLLNN